MWEICSMLVKGEAVYQKVAKENVMIEFFTSEDLEKLPRPRVMNTHIPASHLPKAMLDQRRKLIFVQRNPKDIVVSAFHHENNLSDSGLQHTWDQYLYFWTTNQGNIYAYSNDILITHLLLLVERLGSCKLV